MNSINDFGRKQYMVDERYRQMKFLRFLQRKLFYNKTLVNRNRECRCLVVLHLFYEKSWNEIREYLKNLSSYNFDLIITVTKERISQEIIDMVLKEYPNAQIVICDNKGYDLLPFLSVISTIDLNKYDIVFKLQSKSTKRKWIYIHKQFFFRRDWFVNLYEGILSGKNVHRTIDKIYNQKETAIVAAENLIVKDPKHKANLIRKMTESRGLVFYKDYSFIAGTCFAIKAECLKPIRDLHFELLDFAPLVSSRGMSTAHFVERYLCISVLLQGYLIKGNPANTIRRLLLKPITMIMNQFSSERLFNEDIDLDDEWFFWQMDNKLIKYKYDYIRFNEMLYNSGQEIIPMIDGAPFKYIIGGDVAGYEEYCKLHEVSGLPLMTKERFDCLIKSVNKDGYDERKIIIVDDHNVLLDGQHRACILASQKGIDAYVRVLKIWDVKKIVKKIVLRK